MFPAIKKLLLESEKVRKIVGDRVFPDFTPDGEPSPSISMFMVSGSFSTLPDGTKLTSSSSWQINCIALTRMDSSNLADAVVGAIHCKEKESIKSSVVINRQDEPSLANNTTRRTIIDVLIRHK